MKYSGLNAGDWTFLGFSISTGNKMSVYFYQKFFELSSTIVTGPKLTNSTSITA
jgi:hypothetical protein